MSKASDRNKKVNLNTLSNSKDMQASQAALSPHDGDAANRQSRQQPGWARGLRQLYNSVLDEPLPDQFTDLLKQLDEKNG